MKTLSTILVLALTLVAGIAYAKNIKSTETALLNAMANSGMSVPEYLSIEYRNDTDGKYMVTYGLGGRSCKSFLEMRGERIYKETAKRCS